MCNHHKINKVSASSIQSRAKGYRNLLSLENKIALIRMEVGKRLKHELVHADHPAY